MADPPLPPRGHQCFMSADHEREFLLLAFKKGGMSYGEAVKAWSWLRDAWFALPACPESSGQLIYVPRGLFRRLTEKVKHGVDHHPNSVIAEWVKEAEGILEAA